MSAPYIEPGKRVTLRRMPTGWDVSYIGINLTMKERTDYIIILESYRKFYIFTSPSDEHPVSRPDDSGYTAFIDAAYLGCFDLNEDFDAAIKNAVWETEMGEDM